MKLTYDKEADVLYVGFADGCVDTSDETEPGVIADYDFKGNMIGVEILDASKRAPDVFLAAQAPSQAAIGSTTNPHFHSVGETSVPVGETGYTTIGKRSEETHRY